MSDIKEFLKIYAESMDWETDDQSLQEIFEEESEEISSKVISINKYRNDEEKIVKIQGRYYKYTTCTPRDYNLSRDDVGFKFDWNKVKEVEPIEKMVTIIEYIEKK